MEMNQVSIFNYSDYRKFLADYYSEKKKGNPNYSHRVFARSAGLSSPSHLLMIIKGERNLSIKTVQKFSEGLNLNPKEQRFFEFLVLYQQSEDLQSKAKYFSEIMMLKISSKRLHVLEREKFNFLSKWYVVAIYVLVDLVNFSEDPVWIAKRLRNKITPKEAREALETLEKLSMIKKVNDRYVQSAGAITVSDDTKSVAVYNYHKDMLQLASESLKECGLHEREMNGATISIPKDKLPEIKEKIRAFRKEINKITSSYHSPDEIYQLNIQLFPLSDALRVKK